MNIILIVQANSPVIKNQLCTDLYVKFLIGILNCVFYITYYSIKY